MGISGEQALDCFRSDDLVGIGMEADVVRHRLHPDDVVSYVIERSIDCTALFAAATPGATKGAAGAFERVYGAVAEMVETGASGVRIVGRTVGIEGSGPFTIEWLEELFGNIKQQFPSICVEGLPAADVVTIAANCGLGLRETIARLHGAGLDSLAGDGASIGDPMMQEWLEVHRAAHELGMRTTATMVFGAGETLEQRVDFLTAVGRLQEETGGFTAFVPIAAEAPGGRELDGVTAVERLKALAISRMFLDNIENIESNWAGQGLKVLQMGLRFGANDLGRVGAGDAGLRNGSTEEDLRRIIRDAGFRPVERDPLFRTMFLN
jgi:cyclic dehypoxanthinyl futalosine synthase